MEDGRDEDLVARLTGSGCTFLTNTHFNPRVSRICLTADLLYFKKYNRVSYELIISTIWGGLVEELVIHKTSPPELSIVTCLPLKIRTESAAPPVCSYLWKSVVFPSSLSATITQTEALSTSTEEWLSLISVSGPHSRWQQEEVWALEVATQSGPFSGSLDWSSSVTPWPGSVLAGTFSSCPSLSA